MKYVRVLIDSDSTKLDFYVELRDDNMENRKIELANGGILGFASTEISFHGTLLADTPLLTNREICLNPSMKVSDISREEFESVWAQVVDAASLVN